MPQAALDFAVVVPARFASTRLAGKVLLDIAGKPMVVHVADRARASGASEVCVAVDDERILSAVQRHGHLACMTAQHHASGTDRIAEVAAMRSWPDERIVVNVQGDEPLIPPPVIREVAEILHAQPDAAMSTACVPIDGATDLFNPNVVKVVLDANGYALYFSRATIPWARDAFAQRRDSVPPGLPVHRHIGIYAYRCGFLKRYPRLAQPTIERFEALEQLRALWHGYRIVVVSTSHAVPAGVDTAEELEAVRARLSRPG